MVSNKDFLVVQKHAVDGADGVISCLSSFVVDESIAARGTVFISGNLARKHVAKGSKSIVKGLWVTQDVSGQI